MSHLFRPAALLIATFAPVALVSAETKDHSQMQGMTPATPAASSQSRTPIPPLTDADRAAVYNAPGGHVVHDSGINSLFVIDQLEWQGSDDGRAVGWDAKGWMGGDIDRLWLRTEGERAKGKTEKAEVQALWGHAISPWWDVVAGMRQDFKPGDSQSWAAFGLQGMALYNFEAEATLFVGEGGQTAARLEGDYDILLTNRLVLQPTAEANFYGKNDPGRGIGSGLAQTEVGVRLRYEIRREFAPYVGVTWNRAYGQTAEYARDEGEDRSEVRWVLGVRLWF
ncbi:copper resistance protein B [Pseudomonas proteolytica]|uniref:Copper resistance protein CopB n=1 Tax=Pseudomonas proteolytica TaxID=219574 RepID=A0AAW5AJU9_9PSED|nr:copper resistance protein B [Pseudomonas proteolytica]KAA8699565.1 copper resistance protein B [Pseudomonas proteolytica]MCF5060926.1 copper resistance protein CopB [Pseudomonas proteolytica]MCF5104042.1 copper resistance protein CopB [Pseudomonas proteolytica]TWR83186.1 copper resistance protein B [Pseudomonas proteolytica]SED93951.1 copper resistance protein B [Pseudomonas proteolytica]